jgi:tRNA A37 methylthiotransferase MiaB
VDGEILVRGPEKLVGTFFDVKITGADEYDLVAELVQ